LTYLGHLVSSTQPKQTQKNQRKPRKDHNTKIGHWLNSSQNSLIVLGNGQTVYENNLAIS